MIDNMRYGPHTRQVEQLLAALADPVVRRTRRSRVEQPTRHLLDHIVYQRMRVSGRLDMWDDARLTAADTAVPSQAQDAAGAAIAIVASDLLDDTSWAHYTQTRLGAVIDLQRPGGPLAERCTCGHQLGHRLLAAKVQGTKDCWVAGIESNCRHPTPSLPTPAAVDIAMGLIKDWPSPDWEELIEVSRLIGA